MGKLIIDSDKDFYSGLNLSANWITKYTEADLAEVYRLCYGFALDIDKLIEGVGVKDRHKFSTGEDRRTKPPKEIVVYDAKCNLCTADDEGDIERYDSWEKLERDVKGADPEFKVSGFSIDLPSCLVAYSTSQLAYLQGGPLQEGAEQTLAKPEIEVISHFDIRKKLKDFIARTEEDSCDASELDNIDVSKIRKIRPDG